MLTFLCIGKHELGDVCLMHISVQLEEAVRCGQNVFRIELKVGEDGFLSMDPNEANHEA